MKTHTHTSPVWKQTVLFCAVLALSQISRGGGTIIDVLPEPAADGAYELGADDTWTGTTLNNSHVLELAYIDWAALAVPDGSTVRFTGGVLLDALPDGLTYDWNAVKTLVIADPTVLKAGTTFTVPYGVNFRLIAATVTKTDDGAYTLKYNAAKATAGVGADVVMNGWMRQYGDTYGHPTFNGAFTGNGTNYVNNFNAWERFTGTLDFSGMLILGKSQNKQHLDLDVSGTDSHIGLLDMNYIEATRRKWLHYAPRTADGETGVLTIDYMRAGTDSGALLDNADNRRQGNAILVHSGNTVHIKQFEQHDLHLVADDVMINPALDKGVGNVIIDWFGSSVDGTIFPSANINLRVDRLHHKRSFVIDYTAESNVANVCSLDLAKALEHSDVTIRGYRPALLPRTIAVYAAKAADTTLKILDDEWTFPFDFSAAADDVDAARCEGAGVLRVPEAGKIILDCTGGEPVDGTWPLVTCTSGGTALQTWEVAYTGDWRAAGAVERHVTVDDTGAYLTVKVHRGTRIFIK